MSKAHKAVLDSLRQKPPRQLDGVQTKGIQSFEVHDDLCWHDRQLSLLCGSGTAPQFCYPKQTAAEQMHKFIPYNTPPSYVGKSSCQGAEGDGKALRSSLGDIKVTWDLLAGMGVLCHRGIAGSQAQRFEMRTDVWLWAPGSDPSLISNRDKSLQIYSPSLMPLVILLFLALPFNFRSFSDLWSSTQMWCRLPTAVHRKPTNIFKLHLPRREVCLRLISTSFGIG